MSFTFEATRSVKMKVHSPREDACLRITFNDSEPIVKKVSELNEAKVTHSFHKGLNYIRFEPLVTDPAALAAQQQFINEVDAKAKPTEQEGSIASIYAGRITQVDPFVAPGAGQWGKKWNLVVPPDKFPLDLLHSKRKAKQIR